MKKLVFGCFVTLSVCAVGAFADQMTGYISDAHCGAAHDKVSAANTKCIDGCMKKGSDPVLVSDGKVMKFDDASKDKAKTFAGKQVKIDGSVSGDLITITSIEGQ